MAASSLYPHLHFCSLRGGLGSPHIWPGKVLDTWQARGPGLVVPPPLGSLTEEVRFPLVDEGWASLLAGSCGLQEASYKNWSLYFYLLID